VLGVVGDGGFSYGIAELAAAGQHGLEAKLLLVDDGGYGILREYQRDQFGETTDVDLAEPDFRVLVEAYGLPVVSVGPEGLDEALAAALAEDGPAVVHLSALLEMWS
jgi:acetolactate synthase-1/2/3 large subunit